MPDDALGSHTRAEGACLCPRLYTKHWAGTLVRGGEICLPLGLCHLPSPAPTAEIVRKQVPVAHSRLLLTSTRTHSLSCSVLQTVCLGRFGSVLTFCAVLISVLPQQRAAFARGK